MEYLLEVDGVLQPDPANPLRAPGPFGDKSVIEWPEYQPPAWLESIADAGPTERDRHNATPPLRTANQQPLPFCVRARPRRPAASAIDPAISGPLGLSEEAMKMTIGVTASIRPIKCGDSALAAIARSTTHVIAFISLPRNSAGRGLRATRITSAGRR